VKTWERWSFGVLSLIVGVSGIAYLWMKYFVENSDPTAVVNHPWQPAVFNLHVLASPALILMFGIVFNSHIVRKLGNRRPPNRRTGLISLVTFGTMGVSGYALQVITSEAWLAAVVVVHVASGLVFGAVYVTHLLISLKITRARSVLQAREVA